MMAGQSFLKRDDTIGAVILAEASTWIGTPYRHQGSRKGVGCDCLGLVRGVWRAVYGSEPESPSAYGADWWVRGDDERLLEAAMRHCRRKDRGHAGVVLAPGDLVLFRFRPGRPASHLAIAVGKDRFIHAYEQAGVIASPLVEAWRARIAAVFQFPER